MFVLLFFFKTCNLFMLKILHCFFLSLASALKMLFLYPVKYCFLSLTSMLKILFFFHLLKHCFYFVTHFFVENPVFFISGNIVSLL